MPEMTDYPLIRRHVPIVDIRAAVELINWLDLSEVGVVRAFDAIREHGSYPVPGGALHQPGGPGYPICLRKDGPQ